MGETRKRKLKNPHSLQSHAPKTLPGTGDHVLLFKERKLGQDGCMGQMGNHKINGECRKQKLNPRHFGYPATGG